MRFSFLLFFFGKLLVFFIFFLFDFLFHKFLFKWCFVFNNLKFSLIFFNLFIFVNKIFNYIKITVFVFKMEKHKQYTKSRIVKSTTFISFQHQHLNRTAHVAIEFNLIVEIFQHFCFGSKLCVSQSHEMKNLTSVRPSILPFMFCSYIYCYCFYFCYCS